MEMMSGGGDKDAADASRAEGRDEISIKKLRPSFRNTFPTIAKRAFAFGKKLDEQIRKEQDMLKAERKATHTSRP